MKRKLLILALCISAVAASASAAQKGKAHFGFTLGYSCQFTSYYDFGSFPLGGSLGLDAYIPLSDKLFALVSPQLTAGIKKVTFGSDDKYTYTYGASSIPVNLGMLFAREGDSSFGMYLGYKPAWHSLNYTLTSGSTTSKVKFSDSKLSKLANGITIGAILISDETFSTTLEYVQYLIPKEFNFSSSEINLTFHYWLF